MTSPMHARKTRLKSHLVSAKARLRQLVTPRRVLLLAAAACSASLLLLTLRTLHSAAPRGDNSRAGGAVAAGSTTDSPPAAAVVSHAEHHQQQPQPQPQQQSECTKQQVPAAVAEALVHYATSSSAAPRRTTEAEARAAARVLAARAPCSLLVLGLGGDGGDSGALWAALNHGGRTLFLEPDAERIAAVRAARPAGLDLDAHPIAYQDGAATSLAGEGADEILPLRDSLDCTSPTAAGPLSPDQLEQSPCRLAPRGLPAAFYDSEWDVIVVEAPVVPAAVYTAGVAARARRPGAATDVLVHGVDSTAEETFTRAFLCEAYIKEEAGRLRHFAIPSHRDKEAMSFCP